MRAPASAGPLLLSLSLALAATGCPGSAGPPPRASEAATPLTPAPASPSVAPSARSAPLRYLALGDSYTIGESVPPSERWPVLLAGLLSRDEPALGPPEIVARTGWTTGDLLEGIQRAAPKGPYDLVTLLIGVNNQFRGLSPQTYRQELKLLLAQACEFAGGRPNRVVVLSTPDWGATPYGARNDPAKVAKEIDVFNAIEREAAEAAGVHWVDVTPISREASADRALVASDNLHPSGAMYARWAQAALPTVRGALAD